VAITAPVPRPAHRFWRWSNRWVALSRHPGSSSGPSPHAFGMFDGDWGRKPRRTFRSLYPTLVSPTAVHFELGPRSLDPAAVFAARMPSLFEARRRLTTSATCYYDVRATKPVGSRFLARTMASTTFLFFCSTPLIAEQWCRASRATSASPTPVLVRPGCPSLPSRDVFESAPPPPSFPVGA